MVSGTINVDSLLPLQTNHQQSIRIGKTNINGVEVTNGNLFFKYNPIDGFQIIGASGSLLGEGSAQLHSFVIDETSPTKPVTFKGLFRQLQLSQIIDRLDITRLKADGHASGEGVFAWEKNQFSIVNGHFQLGSSEAKISFDYGKQQTTESVENKTDLNTQQAFEALKDLRCTVLDVQLSPAENISFPRQNNVILKIVGFNPKVLGGYPFEFTIRTTGYWMDLIQIFKQAPVSSTSPTPQDTQNPVG
jgi:hypothetical protein